MLIIFNFHIVYVIYYVLTGESMGDLNSFFIDCKLKLPFNSPFVRT